MMGHGLFVQKSSPPSKKMVRTFDVFDTVIARRCVNVSGVFAEVEQRTGVEGFAQARLAAQESLAGRSYSISDIYGVLVDAFGVDPQIAETLMHTEVAVELENVIPIRTILNKVTHDSVFLVDSYFPEDVVREMLHRAGLAFECHIVLSSSGKFDGEVWRALAAAGVQCVHIGDEDKADIVNAISHGMKAKWIKPGLTEFEKFLFSRGASRLAQAFRAARLKVDIEKVPAWSQALQFNLNLPFTFLSAMDLLSEARATGVRKVLFPSRNGRALQAVFSLLRNYFDDAGHIIGQSWLTSRVARVRGSRAYLNYCQSLMSSDCMMVDVTGTGASLFKLSAQLGVTDRKLVQYVACKSRDLHYDKFITEVYGIASDWDSGGTKHTFDSGSFLNHKIIQMMNFAPEGMVRDVVSIGNGAMPVRDDLEFEDEVLTLVKGQSKLVIDFIDELATELSEAVLLEFIEAVPLIYDWLILQAQNMNSEMNSLRQVFAMDDKGDEIFVQNMLRT